MKRFVVIFGLALVVSALLTLGLNALVDPLAFLGTARVTGFNRDKFAAVDLPRLAKAYLVARAGPRTILLGSSRVDLGIDPDGESWPNELRPVFNLGLPGSPPVVSWRYLQSASVSSKPRLVVLGLVFEDTLHADAPISPRNTDDDSPVWSFEARMRVLPDGKPNPNVWRGQLSDAGRSLLSLQAIGDSLTTILNQGNRLKAFVTEHGLTTDGDFKRLVANEGHASLFAAKLRDKATMLARYRGRANYDLTPIADIIHTARADGARILVAVTPAHIDAMEAIRAAGLLPTYLRWTRDVAALVSRETEGHDDVVLWDFDMPSQWTTEPVPPRGDRAMRMQWWWEPDHFQLRLGDLMVARMFGKSNEAFGSVVTADNVAAFTDRIAEAEAAYARVAALSSGPTTRNDDGGPAPRSAP